ncbi:hypothetical protein AK812_SmicGene41925 [Symbiodinium microadriaticum]|uniref:Uncharacterized protein n=1 Tax=Symbiodinium microadriaticum TaxID=2951 RepID=A0A1Q9C4X1_SYMMI|nr:hypothetical protein AK812_SmicGene41925 [Symbiodinium microadriaticum]
MPPSSEEVKGGGESVQVSGDTSVPWQHNAVQVPVQPANYGPQRLGAGIGYDFKACRHPTLTTCRDMIDVMTPIQVIMKNNSQAMFTGACNQRASASSLRGNRQDATPAVHPSGLAFSTGQ